ncbi:SH3 domain-containing protein [Pacificimonas sp. WHA3]|uniref:SH3 domain-containing protein n=1 Tax=Pacificimonas pallii TaxID=2827236 RepID=A0ABS6SE62_9SPHN|nr:SH3 domain-containing protein [Pacificimonas pallii]MBV7256383.1 SH3 domain-containing protein [Pacificimonas pallii]
MRMKTLAAVLAVAAVIAAPASAARGKKEVELVSCDAPYSSVAITDGDTQGWTKFGLASPRGLIGELVAKSGCFTLVDPTSGQAAQYLMSANAGSAEEIDQAFSMGKAAATQGLLHAGAARIPGVGAALGMFGGLGGKKKTVSAGLRMVNPANGMTLVSSTGKSQKSTIKLLSGSSWHAAAYGNATGQYTASKDGRMLTSAFIEAYNSLVAQAGALTTAASAAASPATATVVTAYKTAIDTNMYAAASADSDPVRALRPETELTPTGNREGLFVEVADNYGTKGWVSVEDLQ